MKTQLLARNQTQSRADFLVIGLFEKSPLPQEVSSWEPTLVPLLKAMVAKGRFAAKPGEHSSIYHPDFCMADEIVLLGLGPKTAYKADILRKAAGAVCSLMRNRKAGRAHIFLDNLASKPVSLTDAAGILGEISSLASYDFNKYKTQQGDAAKLSPDAVLGILTCQTRFEAVLKRSLETSACVAEAVTFARNLVNEPGNIMTARKMTEAATQLASQKDFSIEVLEKEDLKKLKMGGILAVNQGSPNPPALVIMEYGRRHKSKGTLCLVGKGVTFDSGGISLKPSKDMEKMKYDMAGAAAVIGVMGAFSDLKLQHHVIALTPLVENLVSETPQRPGDIIRMFNGKTVEVINTDAEGRLILADALAYCARYKPKAIIDLATLTGACVATFGDKAIGLLGNHDGLLNRLRKAGDAVGEKCWELPLWDEYGESIKGHHSDLANVGGPYAGTITAAMFLKEFIPAKTAWAHLDIAGTAWCDSPRYDAPKGATGVGVRLLIQLVKTWK